MIAVTVDSVRFNGSDNKRFVWLKERTGERYLSVWVGAFEAEAIAVRLHDTPRNPRPLPYDLMATILDTLHATVRRVEVRRHDEGNYFVATVILQTAGGEIPLDARASDAINLAIRVQAPMFVDEALLTAMPVAV